MALIEKVVDMLGTLEPKYQMESLIYSILNYKIRERITETFYRISLVMRGAIAANAPYKDQAIAVSDSVLSVAGIVDTAINNTTDKYRKDITALKTLTLKDQNCI